MVISNLRMLLIAFFCGISGLLAAADDVSRKTPYSPETYRSDRNECGPFFRKLRRIREAEGNAAAAARLDGAWAKFTEQRKLWLKTLTPRKSFDTWSFWVWHEAQFDSGLNDPEWALMLYQWIYDEAQKRKWQDWVTHVRPNLIKTHATLCQWAQRRMVMNVAEDYFASIKFDLDPGKLPSVKMWEPNIPFVMLRQFPVIVPNTKHVVYWQRKEQKDATKPTYMDNLLIGLMGHLALEDHQMGRWDRAIERYLWMLEWNTAVGKHNADPKKPYELKREDADAYREAKLNMAGILDQLGYRQKAIELVDQGLARKKKSIASSLQLRQLEVRREVLLWEESRANGALLAKMNAVIATEGKDPNVSTGDLDPARLLKAACLACMGKKAEAEALLVSVCQRKKRSELGWLDAELALVDLFLKNSEWIRAEKNLRELMEAVRGKGVKIDELALYQMYVKWAMLTGKWEEALRGQREVIRLLEAFRMTPLLPLEHARLARILAETGNLEESEEIAKIAKSGLAGRDKFFLVRVNREIAALKNRGSVIAKGKVRMQPQRVVSVPIEGFPSRTVITLINHGSGEAKGFLKVSGLSAKIAWDAKASHGVVEVAEAAAPSEQSSEQIVIAAGKMIQFSCYGNSQHQQDKKVLLEWMGDERQRCEWSIGAADRVSEGAVIDAGSYNNDPFFMIPVHHHLQSKIKGAVNLRVVTSRPCRVELYDEKGNLQMVDMEGNGSLENSGDWLGVDADRNLSAEIQSDAKSGETRFLLLLDPAEQNGKESLNVRVDWLVDGKWYPAAEDQITAGNEE